MRVRWVLVVLCAAAVSGCGWFKRGGGYYQDDGPPRRVRVDISKIPNAVPKHEPFSETANNAYVVAGKRYYPIQSARGYRERGVASWYGKKFHGRRTASGESYDMFAMTAAHRTLPLPSYARIENLRNGQSVVVKVNDRGPFLHNRLVDLSYAAAVKLGIIDTGTGLVEVASVFPDSVVPVRSVATGPPDGLPATSLFVQLGAFVDPGNARAMRHRAEREGFQPVSVQPVAQGSLTYHRVRIGPMGSVTDADQMMLRAERAGHRPRLVIE
ncbi:MAG: septal ring lytic transglycosylase RlpA family protein [Gammaproteobacteria bacterium]|nr:septal ring lytic transglycosylase RlpA family protein [Gammaproteobacteria bacterium]